MTYVRKGHPKQKKEVEEVEEAEETTLNERLNSGQAAKWITYGHLPATTTAAGWKSTGNAFGVVKPEKAPVGRLRKLQISNHTKTAGHIAARR